MSDELFISTIRYLNNLFWEKKLTPDQISALSSFVLRITETAENGKETEALDQDSFEKIRLDSSGILHESRPERGYAARRNELR